MIFVGARARMSALPKTLQSYNKNGELPNNSP